MGEKEVSKRVLLRMAKKAAKAAGKLILKKQKSAKIKKRKDHGDFALDVDYNSENLIKKIIKKKFPNHSFLCEESNWEKNKSDYVWVIDPLDGTVNYAHNLDLFAVSIAVLHKDKILASVVYAPKSKEFFYAVKGKGAFLNNKRIHVNKDKGKNKVFFTGNPKNWVKVHKKINFKLTRYLGCSSLELAYTACGKLSARLKLGGRYDPYGTAAGVLLVKEAGGIVKDIKGGNWSIKTKGYLASNKAAFKELKKLFNLRKL